MNNNQNRAISGMLRAFCLAALMGASAFSAHAASVQIDFYFDLDANSATGCTTVTPQKTIVGYEQKLSVIFDDATQAITSASLAVCSSGVLQPPTTLDTTLWSITTDPANPSQYILAGSIPHSVFPANPTGVIVTTSTSGTTVDVMDGGSQGFASLAPLALDDGVDPKPIPSLSLPGIFLLIVAILGMGWYLHRRREQVASHSGALSFMSAVLVGALASGAPHTAEAASSAVVNEPPGQATSELTSISRGDVLSAEFSKNNPNGDINVRIIIRKAEQDIILPALGSPSGKGFIETPDGIILPHHLAFYLKITTTKVMLVDYCTKNNCTIIGYSDSGIARVRYPDTVDLAAALAAAQASDLYYSVSYVSLIGLNSWPSDDPSLLDSQQRWGFDAIRAPAAWDIISSLSEISSAVVGIADTGFYKKDSADDLLLTSVGDTVGYFECEFAPGYNSDCSQHGYHVSGIVGATPNNSKGTIGVGSGAKEIQIHARGGLTFDNFYDNITQLMNAGSHVINLSVGNGAVPKGDVSNKYLTPSQEIAIEASLTPARQTMVPHLRNYSLSNNIRTLFVQSSGNGGGYLHSGEHLPVSAEENGDLVLALSNMNNDPFTAANIAPVTIIAGSINPDRNISQFTQLPVTQPVKDRFILAPGRGIYSTTQDGIKSMTGTSQAAPHVTGVAALVHQVNAALTAHEVQQIILGSADNQAGSIWISDTDPNPALTNHYRYLNAEMSVRNARAPVITSASVTSGGTVGASTGVTLHIDPTRAGAIKVEFDPGDGSGWQTAFDGRANMPLTQFTVTHTYTSAGTKSAYLRVTDILDRQAVHPLDVTIIDSILTNAFSENFNTANPDGSIGGVNSGIWIPEVGTAGNCVAYPSSLNNIVLANGLITFGNCNYIHTIGTKGFNGSKYVIEARFAGPGGARNTNVALLESLTSNWIQIGDTNYSGGVYVYGSGVFATGKYGVMPSTTAFKEFRITIDGTSVTVERGDSLASLSETYTTTLPSSVAGRTLYLMIGTAVYPYTPGVFDWVNVTVTP